MRFSIESSPPVSNPYALNLRVGWLSLAVGAGLGLVMGLWSFNGPFPSPSGFEDYQGLSRRLLRLGHIAFFGLGILNLLTARDLGLFSLSHRQKVLCSGLMNFGNLGLPLTLIAAAFWHPLKYMMVIPALSVTLALILCSWGVLRGTRPLASVASPSDTESHV